MGLISQSHSQGRVVCVCVHILNKEMPYYIYLPTLFFTDKLVYPVSRSNNTKIRITGNSAKFSMHLQVAAACVHSLLSFTAKPRLDSEGFTPICSTEFLTLRLFNKAMSSAEVLSREYVMKWSQPVKLTKSEQTQQFEIKNNIYRKQDLPKEKKKKKR